MLFTLDLLIIFIVVFLVVLILTGYVSLCESSILAIVQISIGPALFLFGILTPITDGVNLFINFVILVISFDAFYLIGAMFVVSITIFLGWFFFPIGFIVLFDNCFTIFLLLALHATSNMFGVFLVGCFLMSSCFVYLSAMRTMFFSIISESLMFMLYNTIFILDYFSFFGINDACVGQLYTANFYVLGVLFVGIFWVSMLLDGLNLPFDFMECESELVSGLITELSGVFFVIYSVLEINHLLLNTLLFASLCFGGLFICFNAILILLFGFFYPSVVGYSMNITTAQTFILMFLFIITLFLFTWMAVTNFIAIMF